VTPDARTITRVRQDGRRDEVLAESATLESKLLAASR
jgi:hypothetical protein